jgi:long-chain fatty acid transport protein
VRIFPLVIVVAAVTPAEAGGLTLPVRGVRSLAQAGALVAGADDADALWLDPAGLAHFAKTGTRALLFDAAYLYDTVDYTRVDAAGNTLPRTTNQQPGTGLPTLAGALALSDQLVIAGGIASPYIGLHRYADDSAARYASISTEGSTFVMVTVGAAYAVSDQLRVGATLEDLVSSSTMRVAFSGCPGAMNCAPEDPAFDGIAQIDQTDYIAPSGSVGVQYDATSAITLGATIHAPTKIASSGRLALTLPGSAAFQGAKVIGDSASLHYELPASVRAGVEMRPLRELRVEVAVDVELWSEHDGVSITPDNVSVQLTSGTLPLHAMTIPRHDKTTFSPAIGAEWRTHGAVVGAGYAYETAAAPTGEVSALAIDASKHVIGLGGGYDEDGWQIGAALGYVKLADVDVPPASATAPLLQPLRDTPAAATVNAGHYAASYFIAGLRFARRF